MQSETPLSTEDILTNKDNLSNSDEPIQLHEVLAVWQIQDGLLQSYRTIFLSALSILTASILVSYSAGEERWLFYIFGIILSTVGILICNHWVKLTVDRGHIVDLSQYVSMRVGSGEHLYNLMLAIKHFESIPEKKQDQYLVNYRTALEEKGIK